MNGAEERGYDSSPRACRNCGAALTGAFCAACGQRNAPPNPTLREYADEWFTEILHWDGKLPATLKSLLLRPGELTQDFLAGRRIRWLSPLRTYLICSIVFFLLGPLIERTTGVGQKTAARVTLTGDSADVADMRLLTDSAAFVNDPEVQASALIGMIGPAKAFTLANNPSRITDIVSETIPKVMFVLLPFFALLTWLTWRESGLAYPAHVAFAFHVHAAFFVAMMVPTLTEPLPVLGPAKAMWFFIVLHLLAQLAALIYSTWYVIVACRRALGGTTGQIVVRTTVVGLIYAPFAFACLMVATVIAINAM